MTTPPDLALPAAPAASAAPVVIPSAAPAPSAIEAATAAARDAIANGKPLDDFATPHPAAQQPRVPAGQREGGQFAGDPAKPAPVPGQEPPADGQQAAGTEGQPDPNAAPAGDEAVEPLTVEIDLGGPAPLVLEAGDEETAAQLAELNDLAAVGREAALARQQLDDEAAALAERQALAEIDPVGAALQAIGRNADAAEELVMFLMTQPSFFNRMANKLGTLSDRTAFREAALIQQQQRMNRERSAESAVETHRVVQQNLREVNTTIDALLADANINDVARRVARQDIVRDLQQYATAQRLVTLPVEQLPALLRDRLTALGVDPDAAASRAAVALVKGQRSSPARALRASLGKPATPGASSAAAAPSGNAKPAPTGAKFVASAAARRAAALPGPGAGSPSAGGGVEVPRNPDGSPMSIEQRIAWHRSRIKSGQSFYTGA